MQVLDEKKLMDVSGGDETLINPIIRQMIHVQRTGHADPNIIVTSAFLLNVKAYSE